MQGNIITKPSYVRFAAFAVVLLVSAGLLVTLFDEARAASVQIAPIPASTTAQSELHIPVELVISATKRIPLVEVSGIIESNPDADATKFGDKSYPARTRANCSTPIAGCQPITGTGQVANGITAIVFNEFRQASTGDPVTGEPFEFGPLDFDNQGYGYHPTAGFGYGNVPLDPHDLPANGFGYGYSDGGLVLRFTVTINPAALGTGNYWFTFLADTGSGTSGGVLSSPATAFSVNTAGGGSGGTGTGPIPGPGAVTLTATSMTPPPGAIAMFSISGLTHNAGTVLTINAGDGVPQVIFTLASDVSNAQIDITVWPPTNPPPGVAPLPPGTEGGMFVQITITTGGTTHTVTVFVAIAEGDVDADRAVVLKYNENTESWDVVGKIELTLANGELTGSFDSTCCSTWAVVTDAQDPDVSLDVAAELQPGVRALSATASDNLQVERVEFYVDDQLVGTDTSSPYTVNWQATPGTYTVRAVAYDLVGNSAEDRQSVTVSQATTPDDDGPGPDDDERGSRLWILLLVLFLIAAAVVVFALVNRKRNVD